MDQELYISLIYKELKGEISPEEQLQLDKWQEESQTNQLLKEEIALTWQLSQQEIIVPEIDVESDLALVKEKLLSEKKLVENTPQSKAKVVTLWRRLGTIAAAIIFLLGAGYFLFQNTNRTSIKTLVATNELKNIELIDGTKIWLNKNSKLKYPSAFASDSRKVELTGEAYFEVNRNEQAPFQIKVGKSTITVLGTSFNIDENSERQQVIVSVQEGKVELSNGKSSIILTQNEQGVHNHNTDQITEKQLDAQNEIVWKTGRFIFRESPLKEMVGKISDELGVEVVILIGLFPILL